MKPRWRELLAEEREAQRETLRVAREHGPIAALRSLRKGDLGGPLWQRWLGLLDRLPRVRRRRMKETSIWRTRAYVVLAPVLGGAGFLSAANDLLREESVLDQVILVFFAVLFAILAGGLLYLVALRITRGRVLRIISGWTREDLLLWGVLVVVVPTVAFAAVTAVLVHHELIGVDGVSPDDSLLAIKAAETYAWHLAHAIPILEVTKTLRWNPGMELVTSSGGALVLAFKIVLVLPLVQLLAAAISRSFGAGDSEPPPEEPVAQQAR